MPANSFTNASRLAFVVVLTSPLDHPASTLSIEHVWDLETSDSFEFRLANPLAGRDEREKRTDARGRGRSPRGTASDRTARTHCASAVPVVGTTRDQTLGARTRRGGERGIHSA